MPIASNATPHDEQSWGVGLDGYHELLAQFTLSPVASYLFTNGLADLIDTYKGCFAMNRAIVLEEDGQSRLYFVGR